jgi:competence protein ComEA
MESELTEKYLPLFKQYLIPILLGFLGLLCLGYGLLTLNQQKQQKADILSDGAQTEITVAKEKEISPVVRKDEISVDVEGAVIKPGVYQLSADSRVQDALISAGGMSGNADRKTISKNLNLASKLSDGAKIYIPYNGESVLVAGQGSVLGSQTNMVNINQANESELENLPGIGVVTAGKIISNRPYGSIDELVQKKVIGEKVFEKIKDMITAQ